MQKKNMILISGKQRVGKDTLAGIFTQYNFISYALADEVKKQLQVFLLQSFGIYIPLTDFYDQNKKDKPLGIVYDPYDNASPYFPQGTELTIRKAMQLYGQIMKQHFGQMYWVKQLERNMYTNNDLCHNIVISDIRFLFELEGLAELFKDTYTIHSIRITRELENDDKDISENAMDSVPDSYFDFVIDNNNSLHVLKQKCYNIYSTLNFTYAQL